MERRSKLEVKERAKEARKRGGKATPEQKADRLSEDVSGKRSEKKGKKTKKDTRAAVAKEAKIPEWKLRTIKALKKKATEILGPNGNVTSLKSITLKIRMSRRVDIEAGLITS